MSKSHVFLFEKNPQLLWINQNDQKNTQLYLNDIKLKIRCVFCNRCSYFKLQIMCLQLVIFCICTGSITHVTMFESYLPRLPST